MISKREQKRLKEIIGKHYTQGVHKILEERQILNKFGRPHSLVYIRMVFQGYRKNSEIEKAIIELAMRKTVEARKFQRRKTNLLK